MTVRRHDELAEQARRCLPAHVFRYFEAGAGEGVSAKEANDAWRLVRFCPRVLRAAGDPDLTTSFLGTPSRTPIGIAPTSLQGLAHPEGELAMSRAAQVVGGLMVVSSNSGTPFEEIGDTGTPWWVQAYLTADRGLIAPTLQRAAQAGARAVVLTVDTPRPGTKYGLDHAAFGDLSGVYGVNHPHAVRGRTAGAEHARDLGPHDIAWLGELTGLPVVVKGVLRGDDARTALGAGAAAVWVSNHGGRQLDRAVPTAQALPDVADAVSDAAEIYVDGGLRTGLDVMAALALGARGVFLGRPPLYGLAVGGASGAADVLTRVGEELAEALLLAGCSGPADAPSLRSPDH